MQLKLGSISAVLPLLAHLVAAQWPDPEPSNGKILKGVRDPSLIRRPSDGKYFLFGTNGNCTLHTSSSISGPWTKQAHGALNINQTCVAPQVYLVNDTYYMYYSQNTGPEADWYYTSTIHVASSPTMEKGSWTEYGEMDIPLDNMKLANHASDDGYNILDASLLVANSSEGEDEYYLSFGSYYSGLHQTPLTSPVDLELNITVAGVTHLEWNSTGGHSTEGSFQFAWPTDGSAATMYYLFFSSGQCCMFEELGVPSPGDAYKIMVCRSDTPAGPYVDADGKDCLNDNGGTLVLGSHDAVFAPGGQGVMYSDEVESVVMYYHYSPADATTNYPDVAVGDNGVYFGWNQLAFDDEGWPMIPGSSFLENMTLPNNGVVDGPGNVQTSAARRRLSYPWTGWL